MHPLDIFFWACLMLGGAYTLVTLLMGGLSHAAGHAHHVGDALHLPHLSDIAGHHHAGHGHVGHADVAHHGGHADAHHHVDHHHGDHHEHGESEGGRFNIFAYLNPMSVAGFLLGFGGAGIVSGMLHAPTIARLLYGTASGSGLWLVAYLIVSRIFARAGGTSHNLREDVIGLRAQVTAPIAGVQPGMVSFTVSGARQSLRAITDDEEPIPMGATVRIRKVENNTVHVMRIE